MTSAAPGRGTALLDVGLALALVLVAGGAAPLAVNAVVPASGLLGAVAGQGVTVLAGLALLCRWRGLTFSGLGLVTPRWRDPLHGLQLLALVFVTSIVLRFVATQVAPGLVSGQMDRLAEIGHRMAAEVGLPGLLGVSAFIGLYEELLARGFLLQRARRLLGGWWGPVVLSSLLFGLGHAYQGAFGVLQTALIGAVLAAAVLRYGTLWPAIIAHALVNGISLWALSAL